VVEARIGLDTFQQHLDMIAKSDAMLAAKRREPALAVGKVLKTVRGKTKYKSKPKRRDCCKGVRKKGEKGIYNKIKTNASQGCREPTLAVGKMCGKRGEKTRWENKQYK
jgi:hypothetical protein